MKRFIVLCLLASGPGCLVPFNVGDDDDDVGEGEGEGEGEEGEEEGEEGEGEGPVLPDDVVELPSGPLPVEQYVVQLTWTEDSGDLDLYVAPVDDVCSSFARDIDDTNGFGPEAITVGGFDDDPWLVWVAAHRVPSGGSVRATIRVIALSTGTVVASAERTLTQSELWAPLELRGDNGVLHITATTVPLELAPCVAEQFCAFEVVPPRTLYFAGEAIPLAVPASAAISTSIMLARPSGTIELDEHGDGTATFTAERSGFYDVIVAEKTAPDRLMVCRATIDVLPYLTVTLQAEGAVARLTTSSLPWCAVDDCHDSACFGGFEIAGNIVRRSANTFVFDRPLVDGRLVLGSEGQPAGGMVLAFMSGRLATQRIVDTAAVTPVLAIDIVDGVARADTRVDDIELSDVCEAQP